MHGVEWRQGLQFVEKIAGVRRRRKVWAVEFMQHGDEFFSGQMLFGMLGAFFELL
ncbi:hypothetical protein D3C86_2246560 [compost metagenome]